MTSYDKISEEICKNYDEHETNVKRFYVKSSIVSLDDFYKNYQLEIEAINAETTPSRDHATITDFAEILKAFDEYPVNIQKPKKVNLNRMNSTILKSASLCDVAAPGNQKDTSTTSLNLPKLDEYPTASETFGDFKKFQQQLKQLNAELLENSVVSDYKDKLCQINSFAQQLEKLLSPERIGQPAFTPDEEAILEDLVRKVDDLNFIRSNQDVFHTSSTLEHTNTRLDDFVEVLSHTLIAIKLRIDLKVSIGSRDYW